MNNKIVKGIYIFIFLTSIYLIYHNYDAVAVGVRDYSSGRLDNNRAIYSLFALVGILGFFKESKEG